MPDAVHELLATEVALAKLGVPHISAHEAAQLPRNRHVIVRNPHGGGGQDRRRLIVGSTNGGRILTLVIEQTIDPTTWLIVTGWRATDAERNLLQRSPCPPIRGRPTIRSQATSTPSWERSSPSTSSGAPVIPRRGCASSSVSRAKTRSGSGGFPSSGVRRRTMSSLSCCATLIVRQRSHSPDPLQPM